MHIIKQLSEDEFVIKMDDYDLDRHDSVRIAHDYVQFSGRTYMNVEAPKDWKPYGKFKSTASNILGYYTDLQIPIRQFIKVVLPFLIIVNIVKKLILQMKMVLLNMITMILH